MTDKTKGLYDAAAARPSGKQATGTADEGPRHISKLDATKRSLFQQHIQEALLAIVAAQGKPVTMPLSALDAIAATYRLKIELIGEAPDELLVFTPEAFQPEVITPDNLHRH